MINNIVIELSDYRINKGDSPITKEELEQMIKEGYPISGGGGIPSDYQTQTPKLNGEDK